MPYQSTLGTDEGNLRAATAARYLELLCSEKRDEHDDLGEYCRQFELCSKIFLLDAGEAFDLTELFLRGLPASTAYLIRNATLQYETSLRRFEKALDVAKERIAFQSGPPLFVAPETADDANQLLRYFGLKTHPKADPVANAKFDRFYAMISSADDAEMSRALRNAKLGLTPDGLAEFVRAGSNITKHGDAPRP